MIQFTNDIVAAKFECLAEVDYKVTRPQVYSGPLSGITPAMAEAMVLGKSNLIKVKEPVTGNQQPATGNKKKIADEAS